MIHHTHPELHKPFQTNLLNKMRPYKQIHDHHHSYPHPFSPALSFHFASHVLLSAYPHLFQILISYLSSPFRLSIPVIYFNFPVFCLSPFPFSSRVAHYPFQNSFPPLRSFFSCLPFLFVFFFLPLTVLQSFFRLLISRYPALVSLPSPLSLLFLFLLFLISFLLSPLTVFNCYFRILIPSLTLSCPILPFPASQLFPYLFPVLTLHLPFIFFLYLFNIPFSLPYRSPHFHPSSIPLFFPFFLFL